MTNECGAREPRKRAGRASRFLPLGSKPRGEVDPVPWSRLSRADCLLLAITLHRSVQSSREAASNATASELFSSNPVR
jgi:hypothetical protein